MLWLPLPDRFSAGCPPLARVIRNSWTPRDARLPRITWRIADSLSARLPIFWDTLSLRRFIARSNGGTGSLRRNFDSNVGRTYWREGRIRDAARGRVSEAGYL